jgi:hypothetical protein
LSEREEAAAIMKMSTLQGGIEFSRGREGREEIQRVEVQCRCNGSKAETYYRVPSMGVIRRQDMDKIHAFIAPPAMDVHITKVGTFTHCCGM